MSTTYIGDNKKKTVLGKNDYVIVDTFSAVEGSGGGKGGGGGGTMLRDTFRSNAIAKVIIAYSVGETAGLSNGAKSIYFDGTPLQASSGEYNFNGVTWEERYGLDTQAVVKGFEQTTYVRDINTQIEAATPVVRTVTDDQVDSLRVIILVPALVKLEDNGDQTAQSIQLKYEVRDPTAGVWENRGTKTITGKSSSSFEVQYSVPGPDTITGAWDVRVTRLTADSTSDKLQNSSTFGRMVEILESKETYPNVAYVAVTVDVSLFGNSIPTISLEAGGVKVKVPTNYTEVNGIPAYSGTWNGSFKWESTSNPAWHLYNLAVNAKYGGEIPESYLDKFAFYSIAQYCDACDPLNGNFVGIPDGEDPEGVRRRFTLNTQINKNQDGLKMLQDLASSFRGLLYYGAGAVIPSQDSPKSISAIITNENAMDGRFVYSSSDAKSRYTIATVAYNDKENFYKQAYTTYPAIGTWGTDVNIARFGKNTYQGTKFGCNNEAEAHSFAKWIVYSSLNETEMVSFTAGPEHAQMRPGEVIEIYDRRFIKERFGGRIGATVGTPSTVQVKLDAPVYLTNGQTYEITIVTADGYTLESRDVDMASTANDVATTNIFVTSGFTAPATANYTWAIKGTDILPRKFRILNNEKKSVLEYEILGLFYDENKYLAVEEDIYLEKQKFTQRPINDLTPPTNIEFEKRGLKDDTGNLVNSLIVKWTFSPSQYASKYRVRYRRNGDEWHEAGVTTFSSITIPNVLPGLYDVLVYTRNMLDVESIPAEASYTLIYNDSGITLLPPILNDVTVV
tara:strand:+ start:11177 stop:13546 length:2370 start_codon:yes stop_codon:yes gene_type:complete